MRIRLALLSVLLVGALAIWTTPTSSVFACSGGADWNPIAESDVIIGGQVLGWTALPAGDTGMFIPVRLDIRIDHVWKGTPGLPVIDAASLTALVTTNDNESSPTVRYLWAGSSGACGALDEDPTGMWIVLGTRAQEGTYLRTNRLTTFYVDDEPYNTTSIPLLSDQVGLPSAGMPAPDHSSRLFTFLVLSAVALGVAAISRGISLRFRAPGALR